MALFLIRTWGRRDVRRGRAGRARAAAAPRGGPSSSPAFTLVTPVANGTHRERAQPRLVWEDDHHAPPGDHAASAIANGELGDDDIPARGDSWEALAEFALSYDGYAYWEDLPELANRVLQRWTRDRSLPTTLDELRACLFYEQRRWHHFGEDPAGRSARYMWALVDAIDELLAPAPGAVGFPRDPRPARASETHVQLVPAPRLLEAVERAGSAQPVAPRAGRPVAARATLRPVPTRPAPLRVVAGHPPSRLRSSPPPGPGRQAGRRHASAPADAGAHVRLVSAIESGSDTATVVAAPGGDRAVTSRHPSAWRGRSAPASPPGELRPMPSAEPLPKPPVIGPRIGGDANGRAVLRAVPARPSGGASDTVRVFDGDDAGYVSWLNRHPDGFVLNRVARLASGPPTLHRAGCPVVHGPRGRAQTAATRPPKVCGQSTGDLEAWSRTHHGAAPAPCGRCRP